MNEKTTKPQLHQSHLQMLYRCGEKFRRIVLDGDREPSTTPLVVGTSTHFTVARNLRNKIECGSLLTREAVGDFSRDDFIKTWRESQIVLSEDEKFMGLSKTRDFLQDQTIQLVMEHHYSVASKINPVMVERSWVLEAKDQPFNMSGTIDVDEGIGLRDTKTRKTNLGQAEVDRSIQYTYYALAKYLIDGEMPEYVVQDTLIKPTKTRPARAISYYSKRTKDDFRIVHRRFDQACKIIKSGLFLPASNNDYLCTPEFCGFFADGSCPYVNSKRLATKPKEIKPKKSEEAPGELIKKLENTVSKE